jgi:arginine utilization protein RocB
VLERVVAATHQALKNALETLRVRAARRGLGVPERQPAVLTFAGLERRARGKAGSAAVEEAYRGLQAADALEFSRQATEKLVRLAGLAGPAAVVGFGSLYYPPARLGENPRETRLLQAAARQAESVGREFGTPIGLRPFFPGISDMSFLGCRDTAAALEAMAANTPAFGKTLHFDYSLPGRLEIPVVNLGPWGRDYHQRTERVHMPYSFGVLPELLWRVCRDLLE